MGLLDGKVSIVTGAGGGIGRAEALALAKEGAKVVVNDLGSDRHGGSGAGHSPADETVNLIKEAGGEAVANFGNVADKADADAMVKQAVDTFGRLDIVVNNAGILRDKTLKKLTEEEWDIVVKVHMKGTYLVTQAAFLYMLEAGHGGSIINTSSLSGLQGNFGQANYAAAKAGIAGFTRVVAMEGQKGGIRCNAIAPVAMTRMTEDLAFMQGMGDKLKPEQIAVMVVYLASDLSSKISGKVFDVRGNALALWLSETTKGVSKKDGDWTAEEIGEKINDIMAK